MSIGEAVWALLGIWGLIPRDAPESVFLLFLLRIFFSCDPVLFKVLNCSTFGAKNAASEELKVVRRRCCWCVSCRFSAVLVARVRYFTNCCMDGRSRKSQYVCNSDQDVTFNVRTSDKWEMLTRTSQCDKSLKDGSKVQSLHEMDLYMEAWVRLRKTGGTWRKGL